MSGSIPNPVSDDDRRDMMANALGAPPRARRRRAVQVSGAPEDANPLTGRLGGAARAQAYAQALQQPLQAPGTAPGLPGAVMPPVPPQAAAGLGAAPAANDAPQVRDPTAIGAPDRISTRVPFDVKAAVRDDPHNRNDMEIGIDTMRADPAAWKKNADLIRSYKHIDTRGLNDDEVHEKFVNHLRDNLVWLHDQIPDDVRNSSRLWYDGARNIVDRWSQEHGRDPRQIAGLLAALSPQKDWFQNVDLGRRLLDIERDHQDTAITPQMRAQFERFVRGSKPTAKQLASQDLMDRKLREQAQRQKVVDSIGDRKYGELTDPMEKAFWARAFDEAHGTGGDPSSKRSYRVVTPEGDFGDVAMTEGTDKKPPKPQSVAWGSFGEISKALAALSEQDKARISESMGSNHKVRNFYNNIISPHHGRDVTIDTHAIAAANLLPEGSSSPIVSAGLGTKGAVTRATGAKGLYGSYAEAHRRAAHLISQRDGVPLSPRELQSITWEGVRGLFTPQQKRDKDLTATIHGIWQEHGRGGVSADTARWATLGTAAPEGIRDPKWLRSGAADNAEAPYAPDA